jgi:hypothetical protein
MSTLDASLSTGGWSYAYMHALAECCVLALHQSLQLDGDREAVRNHTGRQQRALENLMVILGALGVRGRNSLMSESILSFCSRHARVAWAEWKRKTCPHISNLAMILILILVPVFSSSFFCCCTPNLDGAWTKTPLTV